METLESEYEDDDMSHMTEQSDTQLDDVIEDSPELLQETTLTPLEATAELVRFRPIKSTPSALKHLLEARADANMPIKYGDISPLRKVLTFANEKHVAEMRNLLLQFGADESDEDRARWSLRRRSDICERIRSNVYNSVDKNYNPWTISEW